MGRRSRLMVLLAVVLVLVFVAAALAATAQPKAAPHGKTKAHAAAKGGGCSMSGESCAVKHESGTCTMDSKGGCSMHPGSKAAKKPAAKPVAAKPKAKAAKPAAKKPAVHAGHAAH